MPILFEALLQLFEVKSLKNHVKGSLLDLAYNLMRESDRLTRFIRHFLG